MTAPFHVGERVSFLESDAPQVGHDRPRARRWAALEGGDGRWPAGVEDGGMTLTVTDQLALAAPAPVAVHEIDRTEANHLLVAMGHYLGPCHRPFGQQHWTLIVAGQPIAVAVSASTVSSTLRADDGRVWKRTEAVELARLAASERWATRVMLRIWREALAPTWPHWPVTDAFAYSQNDRHDGRTYRFDGWELAATSRARSKGGGTWSTERADDHAAAGPKTLWHWSYAGDEADDESEVA